MAPSFSTPLASATVADAVLRIELVEPVGRVPVVRIVWPDTASIVDTGAFPDVASEVARLFARAHIVLAALKASG